MSKITLEMYFVHAIEWGVELVIPPINMKFSHRMSRIGDFSEFRSGSLVVLKLTLSPPKTLIKVLCNLHSYRNVSFIKQRILSSMCHCHGEKRTFAGWRWRGWTVQYTFFYLKKKYFNIDTICMHIRICKRIRFDKLLLVPFCTGDWFPISNFNK